MHLDVRSRINLVELVSLGSISAAIIHPRETFRRAVMQGSSSIIIGHNHPSGEPDPSEEDIRTTARLFEAGNVLGINLLDHIVFSDAKFYRFHSNSTHPIRNTQERGGEQ